MPLARRRLTGAESNEPSQIIGAVAGSLDDPSCFWPQMNIFTADAQPWDMDSTLPKYEHLFSINLSGGDETRQMRPRPAHFFLR